MSKVAEIFGRSAGEKRRDWVRIIQRQQCPYLGEKCYKVRKSDPNTSIGSCTVLYGKGNEPVIICPTRLTDKRQIYVDCLHLLTTHEPGNELHIVSNVGIPGGNVDCFLVSAQDGKVKDFVGVELQTLDTTGTVWPERQRLLRDLNVPRSDKAENSKKKFGMNWKMTAKTILVQIHHKIMTFEHVNKKFVLILQDRLLSYMSGEFKFSHIKHPARLGDSMHFHAYKMEKQADNSFKLVLDKRCSTDADGIGKCLGFQAEAKVELQQIVESLEARLSEETLFAPM